MVSISKKCRLFFIIKQLSHSTDPRLCNMAQIRSKTPYAVRALARMKQYLTFVIRYKFMSLIAGSCMPYFSFIGLVVLKKNFNIGLVVLKKKTMYFSRWS